MDDGVGGGVAGVGRVATGGFNRPAVPRAVASSLNS